MCVCVCTDSFQLKLGSQIDFSVFSAPLFGIFDVCQCTCSQNQCLFPLPLLVSLALLSNVYAATAIISMFSSSRLDLCTAILSNTAFPRVPQFDSEPNTAVNTVWAKSKHHEVLAKSIRKQWCLQCLWERSCSFPIKNGLKLHSLFCTYWIAVTPSQFSRLFSCFHLYLSWQVYW